jgi:hypothetical protein
MKATKILSEYKRYFPFINFTNNEQENVKLVLNELGRDIYKKLYKFAKQEPTFFFRLMSLVAKVTAQPDFKPNKDDVKMLLSEFNLDEFDMDIVMKEVESKKVRNNLVYSFIAFLELKPNFNSPTIIGQYRDIFAGIMMNIQDFQAELEIHRLEESEESKKLHKLSQMIYDYQRLMGYLAMEVKELNYKVF